MPVTNFIWDELSDNVRMEVDDAGAVKAEYMNEPGRYGDLISQRRASSNSFYHFDAQGSTRQLTTDAEVVSDGYTYTAFGESVASSGTTTNPFRYNGAAGYYLDGETGEVYVRRRMYSPSSARWISIDLLLFVDGQNLFWYVLNNPVASSDPSGREACIKVDLSGRKTSENCGERQEVSWEFTMPGRGAPCDGFLVQKIDLWCEIEKPCTCKCDLRFQLIREPKTVYWEAWEFKAGDPFPVNRSADNAFADIEKDTCGVVQQVGTIRYFCKTAEGIRESRNIADNSRITTRPCGDLNNTWVPGEYGDKPCNISTGKLISTEDPPTWWGFPVCDEAMRDFAVIWNCCDDHNRVWVDFNPQA